MDPAIVVRNLKECPGPHPNGPNGWDGRGVEDCYSLECSSFGRIRLENSEHILDVLKHHKGRTFQYQTSNLFPSIGKTLAEEELSRKASRAQRVMAKYLQSKKVLQDDPSPTTSRSTSQRIGTSA